MLVLVAAFGCGRGEPAGEGGGATLMRNLLRAHWLDVVRSDVRLDAACREAIHHLEREWEVGPKDPMGPRIVIADPSLQDHTSSRLFAVLVRIGVEIDADASKPAFTLFHTKFDGASDALVAVVEDPERPGLPLTLLYGNDAAALARYAAAIEPGWKPFLRVYRAGALAIEGPLWNDGEPRESGFRDLEIERARTFSAYRLSTDDPSIRVKAAREIETARRTAYLDSVGRARKEILGWAGEPGPDADPQPIELVLHARPERMLEFCSAPGLSAVIRAQRRVHALLAVDVPDDAGEAAARCFAEDALGPAAEPWIEDGAAVLAAGRWWGRDLEEWIAWLRLGGLNPSIDALVDPDATRANSRHLVLPLRAALFRFLLESRGEGFARSLWKGTASLARGTETERAFLQWLDGIAAQHKTGIDRRRAERRKAAAVDPFLAAVGIEESGAGADRGFGSEPYERSLENARSIGANGAFLTCFLGAERDPPPIADLETPSRAFEPFETDLRVFCGLERARARGMRAFLQPRLLTGPAGTLAGADPQGGERGWRRFFDAYSRFAIHVGLLAELADAEGLVLGGGMTATTNNLVGEGGGSEKLVGWKTEGWGNVLRAARGAFAGCLTWAAESEAEAGALSFWGGLDAIGGDLDPSLDQAVASFDPKPGVLLEEKIGGEIGTLAWIAHRQGKPLIVTRAGFHAGTPRPGRPALARPGADPGMQTLGFEVLGRKLREMKEAGALNGVVLWRWSSDPEDEGSTEQDVLVRAGPAREAAARIFSRP
jgi:hypothetical protein